jgi:hypothetical protein
MTELMDVTTGKLQSVPGQAAGIITVIPSPGSPCRLLGKKDERDASRVVLASAEISSNHDENNNNVALLVCRGATLTSLLDEDDDSTVGRCLALCGTVSDCLVVDGITLGDTELRHSRHARTLSALFRGRVLLSSDDRSQGTQRQNLILSVQGYDPDRDQAFADAVQQDLEALFKAIVAERQGKKQPPMDSFLEMYNVSIVPADLAEQVCFGCYCFCCLMLKYGFQFGNALVEIMLF